VKRIMVIGAPGSGKSTFAVAIGDRLGLPVIHPDRIFWQSGWVERSRADCCALALAAEGEPAWVIDGNFSPTWPGRMARAELVVWLDLPLPLRLWRILRRWARWRGRSRPDMPANCPERLDPVFGWHVLTTARPSRKISAASMQGLPAGKAQRLGSRAAIAGWLAAV